MKGSKFEEIDCIKESVAALVIHKDELISNPPLDCECKVKEFAIRKGDDYLPFSHLYSAVERILELDRIANEEFISSRIYTKEEIKELLLSRYKLNDVKAHKLATSIFNRLLKRGRELDFKVFRNFNTCRFLNLYQYPSEEPFAGIAFS